MRVVFKKILALFVDARVVWSVAEGSHRRNSKICGCLAVVCEKGVTPREGLKYWVEFAVGALIDAQCVELMIFCAFYNSFAFNFNLSFFSVIWAYFCKLNGEMLSIRVTKATKSPVLLGLFWSWKSPTSTKLKSNSVESAMALWHFKTKKDESLWSSCDAICIKKSWSGLRVDLVEDAHLCVFLVLNLPEDLQIFHSDCRSGREIFCKSSRRFVNLPEDWKSSSDLRKNAVILKKIFRQNMLRFDREFGYSV